MKLHLPKLLRVALMSAVCVVASSSLAATVELGVQPVADVKYLSLGYITNPDDVLDSYIWEGSLTIGDGSLASKDVDKLGSFDDNYAFVVPDGNSNKYKVDANGKPVLNDQGKLISDAKNGETVCYFCTGSLTVYKDDTHTELGDVNVQGAGQVLMGGQLNSNYTGLEADTLTISLSSDGRYDVTKTDVNNLKVISGKAELGDTANCTGGNTGLGGSKQTNIKQTLTQSGGELVMGYHNAQASIITNKSAIFTQVQHHAMTSFGTTSAGIEMEQTNGTMTVRADSYASSGFKIEQKDGGLGTSQKMVFRDTMFISGSKECNFNQSSDNAKLILGDINTLSSGAVINFNQSGKGLIHLAYGTNNRLLNKKTSEYEAYGNACTINLNQSGGGTIRVGGGHDTTTDGVGTLQGNFRLNKYSQFSSEKTTYNIDQSKGTIVLAGAADIQADKATIGATLNVESGAVLKAKELNLTKDSNISNSGIIVAGASSDNAQKGVLNVVADGKLNLAHEYGKQASGAIGSVSMTGGELNVNGSVTLGSLSISGGTMNVLIGGGEENSGALTFDSTAVFSMNSSSELNLNFSEAYLAGVSSASTDFCVTIATTEGEFSSDKLNAGVGITGVDARIWSADEMKLSVDTSGTKAAVSGVLKKLQTVNINTSDELDSTVSDIDDQNTVTMVITKDVTISSANTHTGGTEIGTDTDGVQVTLENAGALGAGLVTTKGDSTIVSGKDAEDNAIHTELTEAIQNEGQLTMSGSFKGGNFGTRQLEEAYIDVNGKTGNNGFYRAAGAGYLVVESSESSSSLTLEPGAYFETGGSLYSITENGYASEVCYATYFIRDADYSVAMSDILAAGGGETPAVEMDAGTLTADANVESLEATGGKLVMRGVDVAGCLSGDVSVEVTKGNNNVLNGNNSYTGYTYVDKSAKLTLGDASALGKSSVTLQSNSTMDMNHFAITNDIMARSASLYNAENYGGDLTVAAGALFLRTAASANKVTLSGTGGLEGTSITVNVIEKEAGATGEVGDPTYANTPTNLHIRPNGTIILNDGTLLTVHGSATLGSGARFELRGGDWRVGDVLMETDDGINIMRTGQYSSQGTVILTYGCGLYVVDGNVVVLANIFDQTKADMAAQSNWGIATASRAFVNTVRGQHSHTGCIGNGRGTVWAAVLGAYNDMDGADISVQGAAVGVDAKVGSRSTVGIAAGYTDGEVSPAGLRDVDQEGNYVALYGEHGLKKLGSNSCLSLDWVAAYGQTESKANGLKWEQDSLQLNTRLNWNKKMTDRLCMSVFGGLEYFATGSDTSEGVKSGSIQNLRGEIGVGARYVAWGAPGAAASYDEKGAMVTASRPGCEKLVLNGEIRYFNDMVRSNPVIEMDGLRGDGENPGRYGMGIEAGATYRIGERWSASANYSFNAMEDSTEHRVNVGASYTF